MLAAASLAVALPVGSPVICVDMTGSVHPAFMSGTNCHGDHDHCAADDLGHSDLNHCESCVDTELAGEFMISQPQTNLSRLAQVGDSEYPSVMAGCSPELPQVTGTRSSADYAEPFLREHLATTVLIC